MHGCRSPYNRYIIVAHQRNDEKCFCRRQSHMNEQSGFEMHRQLQEEEYYLPYHWLLRKAGQVHYERKTELMARVVIEAHSKGGAALDIGCGDGRGTAEMQRILERFYRFVGVDYSARAIAFARLMAPWVEFRVVNGETLPFEKEMFQLVVAREVLEHVPPDGVARFLQEIRRVTASGGLFLITTPSTNRSVPAKHFQHFNEQDLRRVLVSEGFEVLAVRGFGWWPGPRLEKAYRKLISLPGCWRIHVRLGCDEEEPCNADDLIVLARKAVSE